MRQLNRIDEALQFTRSNLPHITPISQSSNSFLLSLVHSNELQIVMIKWGVKYSNEYINLLIRSITQLTYGSLLKISIICFTDSSHDNDLIQLENVQYRYFFIVSCILFILMKLLFFRQLPEYLFANGWLGWWYKAYLFSEEADLSGTVLYIDLDTVLCSSTFLRFFTELSLPHILQSTTSIIPTIPSNSTTITTTTISPSDINLSFPNPHLPSSPPSSSPSSSLASLPIYSFACLGAQHLQNEGIFLFLPHSFSIQ